MHALSWAQAAVFLEGLRSAAATWTAQLMRERTAYGGVLGALQAASAQVEAYAALCRAGGAGEGAAAAVCDRCLQPVDGEVFAANLARLRADEAAAALAHDHAQQRVSACAVRPAYLMEW